MIKVIKGDGFEIEIRTERHGPKLVHDLSSKLREIMLEIESLAALFEPETYQESMDAKVVPFRRDDADGA